MFVFNNVKTYKRSSVHLGLQKQQHVHQGYKIDPGARLEHRFCRQIQHHNDGKGKIQEISSLETDHKRKAAIAEQR